MPSPTACTVGEEEVKSSRRKYQYYLNSALSDVSSVEGCYTSKIKMSLSEFIFVRQEYCRENHSNDCLECPKLTTAASCIMTEKVVQLKNIYDEIFLNQGSRYKTDKAIKRLMQLPVIIFPVKNQQNVNLFVAESLGVNVLVVQKMIQKVLETRENEDVQLTKDTLSLLCELASSEKDKKLIKYTCLLSSGVSSTQAKRLYGISEPAALKTEVSKALEKVIEIQDAVNKLSSVQDECVLESLGIIDPTDDSDNSQDESNEEECIDLSSLEQEDNGKTDMLDDAYDDPLFEIPEFHGNSTTYEENRCSERRNLTDPDVLNKDVDIAVSPVPSHEHLLYMLRQNGLNWFSFVTELKLLLKNYSPEVLNQALVDFAHVLSSSDITEEEDKQIEQSRQAFLLSERLLVHNDIISDSESDDPEDYVGVHFKGELSDPALQRLVQRKRNIFKRKAKRSFHKLIAEKAILKRKVPPRASKLLKKYPNLGKDIEAFVRDNRVGADAWRRTGVATFDGNLKSGQKVTYQRIKEHLENKYNTHFSYGAIVQLSVVKNKR